MKVSFTEPAWTILWDQDLIFFINSSEEWEDLISNGPSSQILGPKNDKDLVP